MASQPGAQERLVQNLAGHMKTCRRPEVIRQQLAIFHEVDSDLARRLSNAVGVSEYPKGVTGLYFNGKYYCGRVEGVSSNGPLLSGIRNGLKVEFKHTDGRGYCNGHMNGHPAENASPHPRL